MAAAANIAIFVLFVAIVLIAIGDILLK